MHVRVRERSTLRLGDHPPALLPDHADASHRVSVQIIFFQDRGDDRRKAADILLDRCRRERGTVLASDPVEMDVEIVKGEPALILGEVRRDRHVSVAENPAMPRGDGRQRHVAEQIVKPIHGHQILACSLAAGALELLPQLIGVPRGAAGRRRRCRQLGSPGGRHDAGGILVNLGLQELG